MKSIISTVVYLINHVFYNGITSEDRKFSTQLRILSFRVRINVLKFINPVVTTGLSVKKSSERFSKWKLLLDFDDGFLFSFFGYFKHDKYRKIFMIFESATLVNVCHSIHCCSGFTCKYRRILGFPIIPKNIMNITLCYCYLKIKYLIKLLTTVKHVNLINCYIEYDIKLLNYISSKNYITTGKCMNPSNMNQIAMINFAKLKILRISLRTK